MVVHVLAAPDPTTQAWMPGVLLGLVAELLLQFRRVLWSLTAEVAKSFNRS